MKKFLFVVVAFLCTTLLSAKNVSVTVFPENAVVMQKGKVVQPVTPGVYSLTVGLWDYVFVAQADGYDSEQFIINLKSPSTMQVKLKPNRKQVSFSANPKTAIIYVDGRESGKGNVDFTIYKNETKTVRVEEDGYDTYVKRVSFNDQSDIKMAYDINLERNRRDVNILVDAPAAEFYADGTLIGKGKNSTTITLYKGKSVELVIRAEGFLEYSRIMNFSENVSSYNLTQDMSIDKSYTESVPSADIANKSMEFTVGKNVTRNDAIKRLKYYVSEKFETLEIDDNFTGWYRTAWVIKEFPGKKYVRTRVEIKEVPDNLEGQLKFKFSLRSEMAQGGNSEENFKPWSRVLSEYSTMHIDVRNVVQ